MTRFHVTVTGKQDDQLVRLERLIEGKSSRLVATRALWYAQAAQIEPTLVLVKDREGEAFARTEVFKPDELRAGLFVVHARPSVSISALHLPPEERVRVTVAINGGDLPGLVGSGRVMVRVASIDPLLIEDVMPILSTLLQIAGDEGLDWLSLEVEGPLLDGLDAYSAE